MFSVQTRRREAVRRVVRQRDRLARRAERHRDEHRAEDLDLRDRRRRLHVGEQRRRIEAALRRARPRRLPHRRALGHALRPRASRMRSSCTGATIAPMSTALSSGEPTRSVSMRARSFAISRSRDAFLHEQARAGAADLALVEPDRVDHALDDAVEIGVVEHDERRLLPPSSSESFLPLPAVALRMMRPTSVVPVNAILSTPACVDDRRARVAVAGDDVEHARRAARRRAASSAKQQRGERRELGRLEHDRVARRERRRDLPRQHQQREVPRDDLPDDADAVVAGELASPAAAPSRRDDRSAARRAGCRCRASRGCGLPLSMRLEHGEQARVASAPRARARTGSARARGRRAPATRAAPCAPPSPPRRRRSREPCDTCAMRLPVAGLLHVEQCAAWLRPRAADVVAERRRRAAPATRAPARRSRAPGRTPWSRRSRATDGHAIRPSG